MTIDLRVDLKPNLAVILEISGGAYRDTDSLKRTASLLIAVSRCIEQWQSRHGSHGVPMPAPTLKELEAEPV
jgi:hypothetical protein